MHDPQEHLNGTELGVYFIFQDCHTIAATDLSYSCRKEPQRGKPGNWQLLSLSIQTYPALPRDKATGDCLLQPTTYKLRGTLKPLCQMLSLKNAVPRPGEGATEVGEGIRPGGNQSLVLL